MWATTPLVIVILGLLCSRKAMSKEIICDLGLFATPSGCQPCPKGTYSNKLSNATYCTLCPADSYTNVSGVVSKKLCLPCPTNSTSARGASKCTFCQKGLIGVYGKCVRCPPGSHTASYVTSFCAKCANNYIAPEWNTRICERCPYGFKSNEKRTKCIRIQCKPGSLFDGYECLPCQYNTYQNGTMTRCEECTFGLVTNNFNGPNKKCIPCPPGKYATDLARGTGTAEQVPLCLDCPPNSTTYGAGKVLCRKIGSDCAPNSVEDFEGDCVSCDYNHRIDFLTRTCIPCADGYTTVRGAFKKCYKCDENSLYGHWFHCLCKEGFGMENSSCKQCSLGFYSPQYSRDCHKCRQGEIAPRKGMSECLVCPEGTETIGKDRTRCVPPRKCKPGFVYMYHPHVPTRVRGCISVQTGCASGLKAITREGVRVCVDSAGNVKCPKGSIYNNDSRCIVCNGNWFVAKSPTSPKLKCKQCPRNSIIVSGPEGASCVACQDGFIARQVEGNNKVCYCASGKYIKNSDDTCVSCPEKQVSTGLNNTKCERCENGYVANSGQNECVCYGSYVINSDGVCVEQNDRLPYAIGRSMSEVDHFA